MSMGTRGYANAAAVIWSLPGARPIPKSIHPCNLNQQSYSELRKLQYSVEQGDVTL